MTAAQRKRELARERKERWKARRDARLVVVTVETGENVTDALGISAG
jgi:hypothetical protein